MGTTSKLEFIHQNASVQSVITEDLLHYPYKKKKSFQVCSQLQMKIQEISLIWISGRPFQQLGLT